MALNLGELLVKLGIDATAWNKGFEKAQDDLKKSGEKMQQLGTTLSMYVTLPLTLAGGAVLKFGMDFEKAMTESTAIMGDLSTQMRTDMETTAREVAKTTRFSATDAANSYFYLASAGLDAAQSIAALPEVAKFAQAGNFNMALATDLLTDAQSALGMTIRDDVVKNMENMARVSDVLVKANTLANATVQQFSESLTNKAGAALRLLNKDVEEGVAVLAVFADQGLKGAAAGESLNIVMRDLQRAALNNAKEFRELGVSVFDTQGNMLPLADIIAQMEHLLLGMSDEQRRATLMMMGFQDRSINATMSLLGTSDAIKKYEAGLRDAGGVTQDVADKQMQNLGDQLNQIKKLFIDSSLTMSKVLAPVIRDSVIPALERFAVGVTNVAEKFAALDKDTQETILKLMGIAIVAGPALKAFGMLQTAIGTVTIAMSALKFAMKAVAGGAATMGEALVFLGLNPIALGIGAVAALTAGVYMHVKAQERAREETARQERTLVDLSGRYGDLAKVVDDSTKSEEERAAAAREQKKLIQEIGDAFPHLVTMWDEHGKAVALDTNLMKANTKAAQENEKARTQAAVAAAQSEVERLQRSIEQLERDRGTSLREAQANLDAIYGKGRVKADAGVGFAGELEARREALSTAMGVLMREEAKLQGGLIGDLTDHPDVEGDIQRSLEAAAQAAAKAASQTTETQTQEAGLSAEQRAAIEDEFAERFRRTNDEMMTAYTRAQEDATTAFRREQDKRLKDFEAAQDQEKTTFLRNLDDRKAEFEKSLSDEKLAYERGLDDQKKAFERGLADEKLAFERQQKDNLDTFRQGLDDQKREFDRLQDDKKIAFDRVLDEEKDAYSRQQSDLLDVFKRRQSAEMDALRDRHDDERALIDAEFAAQLKVLRGQQDAIKAAEVEEELARRIAQMQQRVADAKEAVNEAERKGDPKAVAAAQRKLQETLQDQQDFFAKETRKTEYDRIQAQIDALREQTDRQKTELKERQTAELDALKERQESEAQAYQRMLQDEKAAFELRLADRKTAYQRELAELKVQYQQEQDERLKAFQLQQEDTKRVFDETQTLRRQHYALEQDDAKRAFAEAQTERKRQYAIEQEDQKQAFADQQKEQKNHLNTLLGDELRAWSRSQEDRKTRYKIELEDLEKSFDDKLQAQQEYINNWNAMASRVQSLAPSTGGEMALPDWALPSLPTTPGGGMLHAMAQGGIAQRTIFAAGEAGPEVIAPLDSLVDYMTPFVSSVASKIMAARDMLMPETGRMEMAAVGGYAFDVFVQIGDQPFEDAVVRVQEKSRRRGRS